MADVLIVDDNPDNLDLLAIILTTAGHIVRKAEDGKRALEVLSDRFPDLVLLDVEMPVLTGPETADELFLRNCGAENIPVVLVSGVVGLPEIATTVGTPYFLPKPFSAQAVLQMVDRALRERIAPRPRRAA